MSQKLILSLFFSRLVVTPFARVVGRCTLNVKFSKESQPVSLQKCLILQKIDICCKHFSKSFFVRIFQRQFARRLLGFCPSNPWIPKPLNQSHSGCGFQVLILFQACLACPPTVILLLRTSSSCVTSTRNRSGTSITSSPSKITFDHIHSSGNFILIMSLWILMAFKHKSLSLLCDM